MPPWSASAADSASRAPQPGAVKASASVKANPPSNVIRSPPIPDRRHVAQQRSAGRASVPNSASGSERRWHVVKRNESLSEIAKKELGNGRRWPEIWALNRDRIRRPDRLVAGMRLKLPPEGTSPPVEMALMGLKDA